MGYIFLVGCIIFVAAMVFRARSKQAAVSNSPPAPRSLTINFEKMEPLFFWTFVPLVFGVLFYTCVFTPIKGCQDKLTQESEEAIQRMHAREMEGNRRYHEYQRRAYPQQKKQKSYQPSSRQPKQNKGRDPFYNFAAVDPPL